MRSAGLIKFTTVPLPSFPLSVTAHGFRLVKVTTFAFHLGKATIRVTIRFPPSRKSPTRRRTAPAPGIAESFCMTKPAFFFFFLFFCLFHPSLSALLSPVSISLSFTFSTVHIPSSFPRLRLYATIGGTGNDPCDRDRRKIAFFRLVYCPVKTDSSENNRVSCRSLNN